MSTIDHGKWVAYTPDAVPAGFPLNAMHARRESDLIDWYTYIKGGAHFGAQNVKGAALWWEGRQCYIVGPATKDVYAIFPAGSYVFEITNYGGADPQKDYGGKVYNPVDGTFADWVEPPPQTQAAIRMHEHSLNLIRLQERYDALHVRLDKLEKSGGE